MSRGMRLLCGATLLAVAATAVYVLAVGAVYSREASCEQTCRDIGNGGKVGEPSPRPACDPLELELELADPAARTGRRYTLWYRVRMRNVSCVRLQTIDAAPFLETDDLWVNRAIQSGMYLRIYGPGGEELEPLGAPTGHGRTEFGAVVPYRSDSQVYERLRAEVPINDNSFFDLLPGQSVATVPSVLDPYRNVFFAEFREDGGEEFTAHGWARQSVPNPGAAEPPPGFRILDQYVFKRPGAYRIQAVYRKKNNRAQCIYRYDLPWWVTNPVYWLGQFLGTDLLPRRRSGDYDIRAESKILEFKVTR